MATKSKQKPKPKELLSCEFCHAQFLAIKGWQRFCSAPCKHKFYAAQKRKPEVKEFTVHSTLADFILRSYSK